MCPSAPREGWLRVLSNGSCRVAVNGYLLTDKQDRLGMHQPLFVNEASYDISPLLHSGHNTISILAETLGKQPHPRRSGSDDAS